MSSTLRQLIWPLAALALLLGFNAAFHPSFFHFQIHDGRLSGSIIDVLNQGAPVLLLALGMTLVIGTGGIDLSVGAIMAVAGAVAAAALREHAPVALAIAAALGAGAAAGVWNGSLVTLAGIPPIIATLILMVAGRGVAQLITHGETLLIKSDSAFNVIGRGVILGVPVPILIFLAAALGLSILVRLTALGLFIEAIGGNEQASRYAGVRVGPIRLAVYLLMGVLAAAAGLIDAADIAAADANNSGLYLELDAILAVVIGGTALTGGRFTLLGSIIGAIIIQTLSTTILSFGRNMPVELNLVIKAAVVLVVCLLQSSELRRLLTRTWRRSQ